MAKALGFKWLAGTLALLLATASAAADPEILPPQEAFRYVVADTGSSLEIDWALQDGYYLYKNKLAFATTTPGVTFGGIELPAGSRHVDEFFGEQEVYRNRFYVTIPYRVAGDRPGELALTLKLQGCADAGICYPPQTWASAVELLADRDDGKLDLDTLFGADARANGDFLPVDEAFRPTLSPLDGNTLEVSIAITPGYYLYKDKISVATDSASVQLGKLDLPQGEMKSDRYFGDMEVYHDDVIARLPLARATPEMMALRVDLSYQGCADGGICYPPVTRSLTVSLPAATAPSALAAAAPADPGAAPVSEQARLAQLISGSGLLTVVLTFFGAGLLLAFTPCVLPMVPILSGIIAGDGDRVSPTRGFTLAFAYVSGMALVYTAAGIAAAAIGLQLQAIFNQAWVLTLFAGLFVVLALGMFGVFDLQMPSSIQSRLASLSGKQKRGTTIGAFVMGALSSLIVTACVAPPLVATLTVIGQTGDLLRGGTALLALSFGMGAPLLIVGASAGKLLPRAGRWMVAVKCAFGFLMLGLAVWMLSRILPAPVTLALWGVLIFMAGVYLGGLTALGSDAGNAQKLGKGFGLIAMIYGAVLMLGSLAGGHSLLRPLEGINVAGGPAATEREGIVFQRVKTVADLEQALSRAVADGRPAMLDFYADWCVSCIEMEKYTFTDPGVQAALAGTVLLQADVTANDEADQQLLRRFRVFGPPTILFFGPDGLERNGFEVVGYMQPAEFAAHVSRAVSAGTATAKTTEGS
jgi:thiol:disulfide interchange protein DsbD